MTFLECGRAEDILPRFHDKTFDTVITDIPYREVNRSTGGLRTIDKGTADSALVDLEWLVDETVRLTKGWIVIFSGTRQHSDIIRHFDRHKLTTRLGVWRKTNPSPMNGDKMYVSGMEFCVIARMPKAYFSGHCISAYWEKPSERVKLLSGEPYPTPKSVALFREIIDQTTPPDGVILDPFIGSGTTALAAGGRKVFGCDINPAYITLANMRLLEHGSNQA
jgi:site-specific DNA-methyltransferase (adenine-specific)